MATQKGIGIGESDFKALIKKDNYFIDKTLYIKDIIDNRSKWYNLRKNDIEFKNSNIKYVQAA